MFAEGCEEHLLVAGCAVLFGPPTWTTISVVPLVGSIGVEVVFFQVASNSGGGDIL